MVSTLWTHAPIKGMALEATFRLPKSKVDPDGVLSAIWVPNSDLVAACTLQQLCYEIGYPGFKAARAETGHGRYASCRCEMGDRLVFMVLTRDDKKADEYGYLYELQVFAAKRYKRKFPFLVSQKSFPQSDSDALLFESLGKSIYKSVFEELEGEQFHWNAPTPNRIFLGLLQRPD